MKRFTIILMLTVPVLFMTGCKKDEIETPKQPVNLLDVDLTGTWNGYKYLDFSGLVPNEIIQITKPYPNATYYIAKKLTGDNGVPAGMVTWEGDATSNPFAVAITVGDGAGGYMVVPPPATSIQIVDQNTLKGIGASLFFIRRTDDHF